MRSRPCTCAAYIGDILQQALGEDLRHLGVTDLSQIRRIAGLDVGLELLDHVGGIAIELGGLDLNVRMLLVPLGNDVVDQRSCPRNPADGACR